MKEVLIKLFILMSYIATGVLFGITFVPEMDRTHQISALIFNPFVYLHALSAFGLIVASIVYGAESSLIGS